MEVDCNALVLYGAKEAVCLTCYHLRQVLLYKVKSDEIMGTATALKSQSDAQMLHTF